MLRSDKNWGMLNIQIAVGLDMLTVLRIGNMLVWIRGFCSKCRVITPSKANTQSKVTGRMIPTVSYTLFVIFGITLAIITTTVLPDLSKVLFGKSTRQRLTDNSHAHNFLPVDEYVSDYDKGTTLAILKQGREIHKHTGNSRSRDISIGSCGNKNAT